METIIEKKTKTFEERFEMLMKSFKETDKKFKETDALIAKNAEAIKETNKQIFGISNSNGEVAEDTVYNSLEQDMTFAGIEFDFIDRNWKKHSKKLNLKGEYDVILENGDTMALIETKYKVRKDDVSKFVTNETENKFRKLFPNYNNYKLLLGIGGMSFDDDAIEEAKENGIGIIKIIGDKVEYHTEGIKIY